MTVKDFIYKLYLTADVVKLVILKLVAELLYINNRK